MRFFSLTRPTAEHEGTLKTNEVGPRRFQHGRECSGRAEVLKHNEGEAPLRQPADGDGGSATVEPRSGRVGSSSFSTGPIPIRHGPGCPSWLGGLDTRSGLAPKGS